MIFPADELKFNGNNGFGFESYMFATTDKHISRHVDFSDMEVVVICNDKKKTFKGDVLISVDGRKESMQFFNKVLKDKYKIDMAKNANKLHMSLIYLGLSDNGEKVLDNWHDEYLELKKAIISFAKENNKIVAMSTHFHQKANGSDDMNAPHVHILYNSTGGDELTKFLFDGSD